MMEKANNVVFSSYIKEQCGRKKPEFKMVLNYPPKKPDFLSFPYFTISLCVNTTVLFRNVKYKKTNFSYTLYFLLPPCSPDEGITLLFPYVIKLYKCLALSGKLSQLKLKKYLFPNMCAPGI